MPKRLTLVSLVSVLAFFYLNWIMLSCGRFDCDKSCPAESAAVYSAACAAVCDKSKSTFDATKCSKKYDACLKQVSVECCGMDGKSACFAVCKTREKIKI